MIFNRVEITVCICTYKRPEFLEKLLSTLESQSTEEDFTFSVVIVDNDANQSAKEVVYKFQGNTSIHVDYYCEPEQNISLARNMALRNARGDYIAFIDDDEFPDDCWLSSLIRACRDLSCDGIQGPVIPFFSNETPKWVIKGKFYERPNYETGMTLEWQQGRTGNLLLKKRIFENGENVFDPNFGSGGEDQEFFRRMINKGFIFKYCDEARAYEFIPPVRCKRRFLLKRALLRGKMAIVSPAFNTISIVKSTLAIPLYTASLPFLLLIGHHLFMKYLVKTFDHLGKILTFCKFDVVKQKYITE